MNATPKLVDFYPEHLEQLDEIMTATGKPRNVLIRLAVNLLHAHPEAWPVADVRDNNTNLNSSRQEANAPVQGTA
jgi:hypothetical protein